MNCNVSYVTCDIYSTDWRSVVETEQDCWTVLQLQRSKFSNEPAYCITILPHKRTWTIFFIDLQAGGSLFFPTVLLITEADLFNVFCSVPLQLIYVRMHKEIITIAIHASAECFFFFYYSAAAAATVSNGPHAAVPPALSILLVHVRHWAHFQNAPLTQCPTTNSSSRRRHGGQLAKRAARSSLSRAGG